MYGQDIATYSITAISPILKFREICVGMGSSFPFPRPLSLTNNPLGGKCGATALDRRFIQWMENQFGTSFTDIDPLKRGVGSKFMNEFERQKRAFRADGTEPFFEIENCDMDVKGKDNIYDAFEGTVRLPR